jgi:hypothetical protein
MSMVNADASATKWKGVMSPTNIKNITPSLQTVPNEIVISIALYLNPSDYINFCNVSRPMRSTLISISAFSFKPGSGDIEPYNNYQRAKSVARILEYLFSPNSDETCHYDDQLPPSSSSSASESTPLASFGRFVAAKRNTKKWREVLATMERTSNQMERRILDLEPEEIATFLQDGILLDRTGFRVTFNQMPLSKVHQQSLYARKFDDIIDVEATRTAEEMSDGNVSTRRIYKGMRAYFDRSVHSRLPIHLAAEAFKCVSTFGNSRLNGQSQRSTGFCYFEVTFKPNSNLPPLSQIDDDYSDDLIAHVGLVTSGYSHHHPPGSLEASVGYSSRDGYVSLWHHHGEAFQFGPKWSWGDTIGCGFIPLRTITGSQVHKAMLLKTGRDTRHDTRGIIFFTKNGHWVGDSPHRILHEVHDYNDAWHACFGSSVPCEAKANMGQQPFLYEPANAVETHTLDLNCSIPTHHLSRIYPSKHQMDEYHDIIQSQGYEAYIPQLNTLPKTVDDFSTPEIIRINDENGYTQPIVRFYDNGYGVARNVQSPVPLLPGGYFEVHVLEGGDADGFLACGLAVKPYSPFHHVGWDAYSIAFHR